MLEYRCCLLFEGLRELTKYVRNLVGLHVVSIQFEQLGHIRIEVESSVSVREEDGVTEDQDSNGS